MDLEPNFSFGSVSGKLICIRKDPDQQPYSESIKYTVLIPDKKYSKSFAPLKSAKSVGPIDYSDSALIHRVQKEEYRGMSTPNLTDVSQPPTNTEVPNHPDVPVHTYLLPGDRAPDFSAVAVKEDRALANDRIATTTLCTLSSITTDYVVLLYLPRLGPVEVAELLALKKNLQRFREVWYEVSLL